MKAAVLRTLCGAVVCGAALLFARPAVGQVTTGNITGLVLDQQGAVLPGATVAATHTPTGTIYQGLTNTDGRFQLLQVRVGGPYTVKVTLSGFKDAQQDGITVNLGADRDFSFKLELQTRTEAVEVIGAATPIDITQAGATGNIQSAQKDSVPTIARSIIDILQVNPYFSGYTAKGNGQTSFSVAGRNNRYNNIQIDGSVNNDIFGLSDTGTPEGQTNAQPISLDAIQELQLLISPYDVRQGGFSGGGVNIISKSGSNTLNGDGFFYGRSQAWVGRYFNPDLATPGLAAATSTFSDKQLGGAAGGPMRRNKVFFFASTDSQRQHTPSGIAADGSAPNFATSFPGAKAAIDTIISTLQTTYNYNPVGSSSIDPEAQFTRLVDSDKVFGRVDFNLSGSERLTIRHNFVNSLADVSFPTSTAFFLPDNFYRIKIRTNSTVGQLNSTLGNSMVNELRIASTEIRNRRGGQPFEQHPFPNSTVTIAPGITVVFGRDNSSTANHLFQDNIEVNDDLTMVRGNHTFTFGTHDEFFHFRNLFIQNTFGTYRFTSLANFQAGLAQSYNFNFSNTGNPLQEANFRVSQIGAYAGDQWRLTPHLTVTGGVRVDLPRFNHAPNPNPLSVTDFNLGTNVVPTPTQFSPRIGFNWAPRGNSTRQIRGGAGIFSGRTPYVWISNQFSNNGLDFGSVGISNNVGNMIPFIPDPNAQPLNPTGGNLSTTKTTLNLIDPAFKFPSQLRGNLAFDTSLPWGMYGTLEVLMNKTVQDVLYRNLNIHQTNTSALDGRPFFSPVFPTIGNTLFLTNSTAGHGWSMQYELRRPFKNRLAFDVSYLYGQQRTQEESSSSVAATSWGNVFAIDTNNPPITVSDFDPGQRVTANVSYAIPLGGGYTATVSAFYSGQSGHPYTVSYSSDANGDGNNFNDNFFMPLPASPLAYTGNGATYATLLNFFKQLGNCATNQLGAIFVRNGCRAPWLNILNTRVDVRLPFKSVKADITLDAINLLNLLNKNWGVTRYVNFNQVDVISPTVTAGTVTALNLSTINPTTGSFHPFPIDDLRSRWQLQLGARIWF